jgi:hypothetical protein
MLHAHSVYKRRRNCKIAHLIEFDANAGGCETKEEALEAIQNLPVNPTGRVLTIGFHTGFVDALISAISATGGTYLGETTGEDFLITDLDALEVDTLFISSNAKKALDPINFADLCLWNPSDAVRLKLEDFLTAGGTAIVWGGGNRDASSTTQPPLVLGLESKCGPGNAWTWLPHGHADHLHPGAPPNLMIKAHLEGLGSPEGGFDHAFPIASDPLSINGSPSVPDPNHGYFLAAHYIVRNMFADRSILGDITPPPPVGDQVYDWNFHASLLQHFESIPSSLDIVAWCGAYPGNTVITPVDVADQPMQRFPVLMTGTFGAGKIIYMCHEPSFLTGVFGERLIANCFNWLNLI